MVKMINVMTGTEMYVAEDRVEAYKAHGHKLAEAPAPAKEEKPKTAKKTTKKKGE